MLAFIIRRLIGMVLVLFAVSFLVFVIFIVVPGGDPALADRGQERDRPERRRTSARNGASTSRSTSST